MKKLQWYTGDSVEVYPNFYPSKDSIYAPKRNGEIEKNRLFRLKETDHGSMSTTYWIEDIYGEDNDDPDDYVGVEIVEIELKVKDEQ